MGFNGSARVPELICPDLVSSLKKIQRLALNRYRSGSAPTKLLLEKPGMMSSWFFSLQLDVSNNKEFVSLTLAKLPIPVIFERINPVLAYENVFFSFIMLLCCNIA